MVMGKMTLEEVREAAKELTPEEREILSADLTRAREMQPAILNAWVSESERRLDEFESGQEKAYPVEEVFARYRK